eukprot:gene28271-31376_t
MILGNSVKSSVAAGRSRQVMDVRAYGACATGRVAARATVASNPSVMRCSIPSNNSSFMGSVGMKMKVAKTARSAPGGFNKRIPPQMCGIIGIYKREGPANVEIYEGLLMLQHRGQDSAGMVTTDWDRFKEYKENGLVKDVFEKEGVMKMMTASEAQPFFVTNHSHDLHTHGNLTKKRTKSGGRHLRTDSDSEVLLNILANEVHRAHQRCLQTTGCDPNKNKVDFLFEAATATMRVLEGAYSVISMVKDVGIVAFRDPHGIRPLVLGKRYGPNGDDYCIASEDCAFGPIGFERVRDVMPGEMIIITPLGKLLSRQCVPGQCNPCIFEYIYLARPDSVMNNIPVYNFQLNLGTRLAKRINAPPVQQPCCPDSVMNNIPVYNFQLNLGTRLAKRIKTSGWDIDLICPVPDGSRPAAIQMAADLALPYRPGPTMQMAADLALLHREGLVKNRYVGRTFIMPDQRLREMSVRRKLNAMPTVFKGKNVLLVDDSIVRGTTMSQIVDMVRKAGAAKVYLCSASPPVIHANVYGVDLPNKKEFVANGLTVEQICGVLGADGLIYQTVEDLIAAGVYEWS